MTTDPTSTPDADRPRDDGPQPFEPVRFGRSPIHRIPTVSVIAFAVVIVIVSLSARGPVRWLMLAVVLVAALSAWRSYRIRRAAEGGNAPGTGAGRR